LRSMTRRIAQDRSSDERYREQCTCSTRPQQSLGRPVRH